MTGSYWLTESCLSHRTGRSQAVEHYMHVTEDQMLCGAAPTMYSQMLMHGDL